MANSDVGALIRKQSLEALQRAAKEAKIALIAEHLTCDIGPGLAVVTAPIARKEIPTEQELKKGVDLAYAYVSLPPAAKVKPGFYVIRVVTPGFDFKGGTVKVSLVDPQGKAAYSFQGSTAPLGAGGGAPSADESLGNAVPFGKVCGSKKCFTWKRVGRGSWEWGCTDLQGNVINCVDQQP
jgi:hypothetical protein